MKRLIMLILPCILLLPSCASSMSGVLRQGGAAELTLQASLGPRMVTLIRSLRAVAGDAGSENFLDGCSISRSMSASPGVASVNLVNTSSYALEGSIAISRIEDFLSVSRGRRFISYTESVSAGRSTGRIQIYLDKETAPELVNLLSPEARVYLEALMAPAILGDSISKNDYLLLVSSLYGRALADEIRSAQIQAAIDFPGPITAIQGGAASGRRAEFTVPLLDLLVLETPLSWEIAW